MGRTTTFCLSLGGRKTLEKKMALTATLRLYPQLHPLPPPAEEPNTPALYPDLKSLHLDQGGPGEGRQGTPPPSLPIGQVPGDSRGYLFAQIKSKGAR